MQNWDSEISVEPTSRVEHEETFEQNVRRYHEQRKIHPSEMSDATLEAFLDRQKNA